VLARDGVADHGFPMLRSVLLLTKGIIRDQKTRRNVMFYVMLAALVMLFAGTVFIPDAWAREHVWLFIFYWLACAWLTLTGLLLAAFDILLISAASRIRKRKLEEELLRATGEEKEKP